MCPKRRQTNFRRRGGQSKLEAESLVRGWRGERKERVKGRKESLCSVGVLCQEWVGRGEREMQSKQGEAVGKREAVIDFFPSERFPRCFPLNHAVRSA